MVADLSPVNPVRLALMLNICVFYYEILNPMETAHRMANQAIDEALPALKTSHEILGEKSFMDTSTVLKRLSENINIWASELLEQICPE
ncbi:14-3-3-like protein G-BOX factor 14 kappa [Typha latifolia]|uniref:14-3-3-like protein G-BOX factor 14 kappa n=1 Tax=Typha latifolia TaxID=4733 RepID=UPI003C2DA0B9